MTTDTTALQERVERAVADAQNVPFPGPKQRKIAAAVLPIIAAEVRAASEKAWDEATRNALNFAYLNQEDGITLYLRPPHDRNPYTEKEADHG